ncbi:MAG: putative viral replication protein [Citataivirus uhadis]|uniref:Viral replication protein n=1 Tax=Cressdnaviricota sp. TaxID=2748378 RepID=A0A345N0F7_9VIRU|nr:MAG: putative viral replication protein [Cressdnaviricota sp.]
MLGLVLPPTNVIQKQIKIFRNIIMKQKQTAQKSRSWCLTYYPHNEQQDLKWFNNLSTSPQIRYFIVGREICPSTERLHFQGYISFKNAKTFKQTKKWFQLDKIHLESAKGNDFKNQTYCSKENKIIEIGKPIAQGKRSDISEAISILGAKASMSAVLEKVHNYQAVRHAELYLKYKEPKREISPIEVIWIYGSSGKGKTRKVFDDNTSEDIFTPISYKWWEGYDAHKVVLIDDIRRDFCKFHELLKLLDIYPFRVETKGGSRQVQFKKIYITAPYSPLQMWEGRCVEDLCQLTRRITQTINMDEF